MTDLELQLLELIEAPIFALEPNEANAPVYVAFNAAARRISRRPLEDYLGRDAREIYPGGFGEIAYHHHCEVLAVGAKRTYEITLPLADTNRTIRTHLTPAFDDQGRVIRLIGTSEDITAEYGVRRAEASSIVLNTELEQFVNMAAHDLRSPIRHVGALANMLRQDLPDLDGPQLHILNKLEMVAEKAMTLISDVLTHSQTAGASQSIEDFELSALCTDIGQMLDPNGEHQIEVTENWLFGDKIATQIVLRNLIDNAVKHNSGRPIKLSISAAMAGPGCFEVTIADNGVGFSDPAIAFLEGDRFRQDTGFGLLGVSRLVKTRQGSITAENATNGTGAVIRLVLPGKAQTRIHA